MHDNDRNAAPVASRSRLALILVAATLAMLVPLAGCSLDGLDQAIADEIDEALNAPDGDVQVNVSGAETRVGACVTRGLVLFPGPCKGPEDGFTFKGADDLWHHSAEPVATMPAGTELAIYWQGPEGQSSFAVTLPPAISILAPQANTTYRMGDTVTLQWPDLGADEITVENKGSCTGAGATDWWRVIPHDDATPGTLVVGVADLVLAERPFERCDITLRVTGSHPGTFTSSLKDVSGRITANTSAEVTIQILP